jgi:hypothetical protein
MVVVVVMVMLVIMLVVLVVVVIGGLGGATELRETEIRGIARGRERFEANYGKLEGWFGKRFERVEWRELCVSGEGSEFGGGAE